MDNTLTIATPLTDEISAMSPASCGLSEMASEYNRMLDHARELERELHATRIAAGVASLERGEWTAERKEIFEKTAAECDHEADRQSAFSNEAKEHGLKLAHSTAAWACLEVAKRIRAMTEDEFASSVCAACGKPLEYW